MVVYTLQSTNQSLLGLSLPSANYILSRIVRSSTNASAQTLSQDRNSSNRLLYAS